MIQAKWTRVMTLAGAGAMLAAAGLRACSAPDVGWVQGRLAREDGKLVLRGRTGDEPEFTIEVTTGGGLVSPGAIEGAVGRRVQLLGHTEMMCTALPGYFYEVAALRVLPEPGEAGSEAAAPGEGGRLGGRPAAGVSGPAQALRSASAASDERAAPASGGGADIALDLLLLAVAGWLVYRVRRAVSATSASPGGAAPTGSSTRPTRLRRGAIGALFVVGLAAGGRCLRDAARAPSGLVVCRRCARARGPAGWVAGDGPWEKTVYQLVAPKSAMNSKYLALDPCGGGHDPVRLGSRAGEPLVVTDRAAMEALVEPYYRARRARSGADAGPDRGPWARFRDR